MIRIVFVVPTPIDEKRYIPRMIIRNHRRVSNLYFHVLEMIRPEIADAKISPPISGVSTRPALVAEPPMTHCAKIGIYMIAQNMPMEMKNRQMTETRNTLLAKSHIDKIGSLTRFSTITNHMSEMMPIANAVMICHDARAYWLHHRTSARRIGISAAEMKNAQR